MAKPIKYILSRSIFHNLYIYDRLIDYYIDEVCIELEPMIAMISDVQVHFDAFDNRPELPKLVGRHL